jgi:hypothetical protein
MQKQRVVVDRHFRLIKKGFCMYERHDEPLAPVHKFVFRMLLNIFFAILFVLFALSIGILGLHVFEEMPWINSFCSAAMILSGVGSSAPMVTPAGQLFAGIYSLFSGLAFLSIIGFLFAPVIHRCFHNFYLISGRSK